jgi:ABC-type transport system involved in multi-copper enzyme maturation permease subunit
MRVDHLRDVPAVLRLEVRRTIGSLRGILVLLIYLFVSLGVGSFYVTAVRAIEEQVVKAVATEGGLGGSARGAIDISKTDAYKKFIGSITEGDSAKEQLWLDTPPIVLASFYFALLMLPLLVLLAAHDVIARDTELRTARFLRPKMSAVSWVLGKFLAQALLIFIATVLSGAVMYLIAVRKLESFEAIPGLWAFTRFWARLLVSEIGFLGVMFLLSSLSATSFTALMFSGLATMVLWLLHLASYFKDGEELRPIGYLSYLSPFTYRTGLWMPIGKAFLESAGAYAMFAVIGLALTIYRERVKDA